MVVVAVNGSTMVDRGSGVALTATTTTFTTITGEKGLMVHQEGVIVRLIWRNADMCRHMHALMDAHMDGVRGARGAGRA